MKSKIIRGPVEATEETLADDIVRGRKVFWFKSSAFAEGRIFGSANDGHRRRARIISERKSAAERARRANIWNPVSFDCDIPGDYLIKTQTYGTILKKVPEGSSIHKVIGVEDQGYRCWMRVSMPNKDMWIFDRLEEDSPKNYLRKDT